MHQDEILTTKAYCVFLSFCLVIFLGVQSSGRDNNWVWGRAHCSMWAALHPTLSDRFNFTIKRDVTTSRTATVKLLYKGHTYSEVPLLLLSIEDTLGPWKLSYLFRGNT